MSVLRKKISTLFEYFCWVFVVALMAAAGCSTNPATGKSDFVLISEEAEIKLGREAHPEIKKQFGGAYDHTELEAYVQGVGEKLAAHSHRSELVYRFTVLDSDQVNAFALPGGYIYITRGLLAYLNSEAEMAAVLGHEIGHVTARHSVRQISAARAANIGYTLGSIFIPEMRVGGAQDLFNLLGSALLSGYGRDHELEADRLGAEYLVRTGFDSQAMTKVIGVLKDQEGFEKQLAEEQGRKPRVYHGVFASHPDNDTRLQEVVASADPFRGEVSIYVHRQQFLQKLEGLTFGDSEREGVRRGSSFYHKDLGFALSFPEGWRIENLPDSIVARPPSGEAILQLTMQDINKRISPREFMISRLKLKDIKDGEAITSNGLEGYTAIATLRTPLGKLPARVTILYLQDRAIIAVGAAEHEEQRRQYDDDFVGAARSLHALREDEQALARALRLKIVQADENTTFADLAKESEITHHAEEQLRLLNQRYPTGKPQSGELLKVVE